MAIGDTVQAGLMRIDTSAYERAGQANANANMAFGNALNQVAKGFIEGQEKKARAEEMTGYLMNQGVSEKDAKAIAKNPFLQKEYQRKKATEAQMKMEGNRLQMEAQKLAAQQKQSSDQAFQKNREMDMKEKLFSTQQDKIREAEENEMGMAEALLAETTDPAVLEDYNQAQPGLFALGGDQGARNRFLEFQRDEAPKVLGGELGSSDFGRYAREQNLDPVLAKNRFMELQKAEADLAESNRINPKDAIDLKNKEETTRQLFDKPLNDLSANFDKNKQVQDYKNVVISYNTISSAAENPSAAGDLSLIFQYMKVLDPGSTVREGEFANAQNAAGVPDRIRNMFNNWSKGQRLDEKQRQDFITQAKKIVEARGKSIDPLIRQTRQKFDRTINKQNRNLAPDQANLLFEEVIFPDIRLPQNAQPQGQPPQDPSLPQVRTLPGGGIFTPIAP
jgi:hypothetical protein